MSNRPLDGEFVDGKFISPQEMKHKYPNGGYKIVGDVTKNKNGEKHTIKQNSHKGPFYKTVGYVWNEEEQGYLVIKKFAAIPIIIAIIIIAVAVIIGIIIWAFAGKSNGPDIDPNASKYVASNLEGLGSTDPSKILLPGFDEWKMYTGSDKIYVTLVNPDVNQCYFQYDIILDLTGEVLFSTKLIPPGNAVTEIKLPRKFQKGVYPITAKINTYSLEDPNLKLNGGEAKTKIVVADNW